MSVEKSFLVSKALRDFGDVVDALDAFDDVEKGERWEATKDYNKAKLKRAKLVYNPKKQLDFFYGGRSKRKAVKDELLEHTDNIRGARARYIMAPTVNRKKAEARAHERAEARAAKRGDVKKAYLVPVESVDKLT
jgi:hypothetical protein